jgi:hypothetical protein
MKFGHDYFFSSQSEESEPKEAQKKEKNWPMLKKGTAMISAPGLTNGSACNTMRHV